MKLIAVLLTCHNRKDKTFACLESISSGINDVTNYSFDIFLVDDKSTDGTSEVIRKTFPDVHITDGTGCLYWAGGMRLAWQTALKTGKDYNGYLLINDDVTFFADFWTKIETTIQYSETVYNKKGIYTLSVMDERTKLFTYGGHNIRNKALKHSLCPVTPTDKVQECQLTNANILYVSKDVFQKIGILDSHYIHSLADFDYSLMAGKHGFPVLVCPEYGGFCPNDNSKNVLDKKIPLKQRIRNLYSTKGIALNMYLYYLNKHFLFKAPYAFIVLWLRVLFPQFIKK